MIQLKTWMRSPTSNTAKTLQTWSLNHRHLGRIRKYTPVPALHRLITLLSDGNATLMGALRRTYNTIPTTHLRRMKSTNISTAGSRRKASRRTMTTCGRQNTPLYVSQASKKRTASRSSWLGCQMIRLRGVGTTQSRGYEME